MTTPIRPPLPRPVALPDPGAAEGAVPARTPIPDLPLGESAPEESSSWWSTGLNAPVASVIPVQGGGLNDANRLADGLMSLGFELLESDEPSDVLRLRGEIENYPRPVNVFIPSDFVRDTEFDLALHLHGWTNAAWTETERVVFGEFDFRAIAGESGALLVVPESDHRCQTYKDQFNHYDGADRFFSSLTDTLVTAGVVRDAPEHGVDALGRMTITGHSGAYNPIAMLASHRDQPHLEQVVGIGLLDATYGSVGALANWAQRMDETGGRFESWVLSGTQTHEAGRQIEAQLEGEISGGPEVISQPGPGMFFVDTGGTHSGMVGEQMGAMLERLLPDDEAL